MPSAYYLTAAQAADALGVTRATLYAYASRGQLRSEPAPGRQRERRYHREDVERLKERQAVRRDPAAAAARGLHWGGPLLESGITLIHGGGLYYRGRDASALARTASVEQVAALLWEVDDAEREALFRQPAALSARQVARLRIGAADPFVRLQAVLPIAGAADAASYDLRPAAVRQTAARIIRLLTSTVARRDVRGPIHAALQAAWAPKRPAVADVIRTALVLCADHELNVSTFAARCTASAGASPYDVVSAALATLKGFRHGGAAERVLALASRARSVASARAALAERLRLGDGVQGFGHPLYPDGDPRALLLMRLAEDGATAAAWRPFRDLRRAGAELLRDH